MREKVKTQLKMKKINIERELKYINNLKTLSFCQKKLKREIILKAKKDFISILRDCIYNVLLGNIKLNKKEKEKLIKHKYTLRKIVKNKQTNKNRELLLQKGGSFLPIILPGAISLLSVLIDFIQRKKK